MERHEVIQKIVDELGEKAIPRLVDMLKKEEDPELWELVCDALVALGNEGMEALYSVFMEAITPHPIPNDPFPLVIAGILAEHKYKKIEKHLPLLMEYYDELGQLLIYDMMVELGKYHEKLPEIIAYHLLDEESDREVVEISAMILGKMATEESLQILLNAYEKIEDHSIRAIIVEAIYKSLVENPALESRLRDHNRSEEVLEKMRIFLDTSSS